MKNLPTILEFTRDVFNHTYVQGICRRTTTIPTTMKTPLSYIVLLAAAIAATVGSTHAQTANWTGGGSDTDWNNGLNWDIGTPAEGTNAIISAGLIVDYNAPMAATSFAGVNSGGALNINAAGFNIDAAGLAAYTGNAASLWKINSGGVVVATNSGAIALATGSEISVDGGVLIITNSTGNITFGQNGNNAGAGFTNNGGTVIFSQPFQSRGRNSRFVMNGGLLDLQGGGGIFESSNDQERQFPISGGVANLGNFTIGRTLNTVGSAGLVVSNGTVNLTALQVGTGIAASGATVYGGAVTNTGVFTISDRNNAATSGQRRAFFYMRGGTVVSTAPAGIVIANQANNSSTGGSSIWGGFLDMNAGLLIAEQLTLVGPNALTNAHGTLTLSGSGSLYLGSGGLVGNVGYSNTSYTMTLSGGTLGAKANYSIAGNGTLSGTFTVKAADLANTPHDITLNGSWGGSGALVKTGGGILTLNSNTTFSGATTISAGTLALGVSGTLVNSPQITLASGATWDVSAAAPYALTAGKTLEGSGTVNGSLIANSGATLRPAGAGAVGILTFTGGLTQNGDVINAIEFGPLTNDVLEVSGDLNLNPTATNSFVISSLGGSIAPGTYTLIHYTGTLLNGDATNFKLSGLPGTVVHNAGAKTISVTTTGLRAPTDVFWVGTGGGGNWDAINSLNWNDGAPGAYFVNGDVVRFDANGAANPAVNLTVAVSPASVTVDAATDYSFNGVGSISGTGGLSKTNVGKLTIQTTNNYTGGTAIRGGTISVANLANGGFASSLGASPAGSANLVLDAGTLQYTGATVASDRGATLSGDGGTVEVPSAATSLTLSGVLTGNGSLTKAGPGVLVLSGGNNFTNGVVINAGVLQLNTGTAAGSGGITNNAATLRVSGATTVDNQINFNGACGLEFTGVGSGNVPLRGAWTGSGTVNVNFLTQNASQTFSIGGEGAGGGYMWDFSGTVNFGASPGFVRLNNNSTINLGSSNATFNLGTSNLIFVQRNGGTTTHLGALLGGPATTLSGARNDVSGITTYSIGGKNLDTVFEGTITNGQSGSSIRPASIIKVGTGKLTLTGFSPYTGTTVVEAGTLQVDGQITASTITLFGGMLAGNGSIGGAVDVQANAVLSPGASIGRLTMTSSLTLQFGSTNIMEINKTAATNDSIVGLQSVVYGGTLVISNLAGTLADGDTFKLFDSLPDTYVGAFESIELPALGTDLYWDTSRLTVDGTIRVFTPRPIIQSFGFDGSNFFLTGTNGGNTSTQFILLTSTNVALPAAGWTSILTNNFDGNGNFAVTNAVNPSEPQRYYQLKTP
jgi:fibronectin-binding autotransporter adhesin